MEIIFWTCVRFMASKRRPSQRWNNTRGEINSSYTTIWTRSLGGWNLIELYTWNGDKQWVYAQRLATADKIFTLINHDHEHKGVTLHVEAKTRTRSFLVSAVEDQCLLRLLGSLIWKYHPQKMGYCTNKKQIRPYRLNSIAIWMKIVPRIII